MGCKSHKFNWQEGDIFSHLNQIEYVYKYIHSKFIKKLRGVSVMAKQKAKMSSKNKSYIAAFIFVIISLALGVFLYIITKESLKTTQVIVSNRPIKAGHLMSDADLGTISVGKQGLQNNVAIQKSSVVGKYALRDMMPNEYIFSTSLTDDYIKRLSEKAKYGAIAIPIDNLDAVTGDIKENDFVGAYISVDIKKDQDNSTAVGSDALPNATTALIYSKELTSIRVLGLYDGNSNVAGVDSKRTDEEGNTTYTSPSMIVFDAMPAQRTLLIQAIDNGKLRLIIHPEYIQKEYRKAWGLEGADSIDSPENELQKDEIQKNIEDQERIKNSHDQISESPSVNSYMESQNAQNNATTDTSALKPSQGTDHLAAPGTTNK